MKNKKEGMDVMEEEDKKEGMELHKYGGRRRRGFFVFCFFVF